MEIDNEDKSNICIICCQSYDQKNVIPVDKFHKKMLQKLLLDPDPFVNKTPIICNICVESVEKCYFFKLSCLCTEKNINSYIKHNPNAKCDIVDIYLYNFRKESKVPEDYIVCRFCMALVYSRFCWLLNDEIENITVLMKMITGYFPELNLSITDDPAICINCLKALQNYFGFIKHYSQNKISSYNESITNTSNKKRQKFCVYSCSWCTYKTEHIEHIDHLTTHDDSNVEIVYQRVSCKFETTPESAFLQHMITCTAFTLLEKKESRLETEKKNVKAAVERPVTITDAATEKYECKLCAFNTEVKKELTLHTLSHTKARTMQCETCLHVDEGSGYGNGGKLTADEIVPCIACQFRKKCKEKFKKIVLNTATSAR